MLTPQQIQWASKHDWFIKDCSQGVIKVWDRWTLDGTLHEEHRNFDNFGELLRWAGY